MHIPWVRFYSMENYSRLARKLLILLVAREGIKRNATSLIIGAFSKDPKKLPYVLPQPILGNSATEPRTLSEFPAGFCPYFS
jgi:hypothetical protein